MARSKRNFPLPIETPPITLLAHLDLIDEKGRLSNAAILSKKWEREQRILFQNARTMD